MAEQADLWPVEIIGGTAFSKLNVHPRADDSDYRSFGLRTVVLILVVCVSLGFVSNFVIKQIAAGNFIWGQIFAYGLFGGMYAAMIIGATILNKKNKEETVLPPKPEHVPDTAMCVLARSRNSASGSRSLGWLWYENGMVFFWGETFWFGLKREDFRAKNPGKWLLNSNHGVPLVIPKGLPQLRIMLMPVARLLGNRLDQKVSKARFEGIFAALDSTTSTLASVFPPIRTVVRPVDPTRLAIGSLLSGLFIGLCIHLGTWQVAEFDFGPRRINPADGYLMGILTAVSFGALIYSMNRSALSINRKLDQLQDRR